MKFVFLQLFSPPLHLLVPNMDRQYIHSVSTTLAHSRSIHQSKLIILGPAFNQGLLASFNSDAAQIVPDGQVSKLVVNLYSIFSSLRTNSLSTDLILSAITTVGSLLKAHDPESPSPISVPALTGSLQALTTLARRMIRQQGTLSHFQPLLDALRLEYAHLRRDAKTDMNKKIGMVVVLIEMIKICVIDLANPNIIESILASTQGILDDNSASLPKSISATYHFYLSKHHLFLDQFNESRAELETALSQLCPNMPNTNRVLFYLIPLQLVSGIFPTKQFLKKFPPIHDLYYPIIRAIKSRNLKQLHDLINKQSVLKQNFFFLLKKIDLLVHRLILRDIVEISGGKKQVSFALYSEIVPGVSPSEIFAILIQEGLINGYISYEESVLVLTGTNPFPVGPWANS
jgi:hypothetical protein